MKTIIEVNTNGKGPNTEEKRLMVVNEVNLVMNSEETFPDDPFYGILHAKFEPSGFGRGSWNTEAYGFVCGDKQWIREFKLGMREYGLSQRAVQNISYADFDVQGDDFVALRVGPAFYASWKRLLKKQAKNNA